MKITAKDFFLQLGALVALYAGAIALINLLFKIINVAFPPVGEYGGYFYPYYSGSPISLPVATLIIVFPLFLFLSSVKQKGFNADPTARDSSLRRWLLYVTLFVAGAVMVGDLITLIYKFLDGRELTSGFFLKVLAVLVVAGGVFFYYLSDLRQRLNTRTRTLWRVFSTVLVVGSIILGFIVMGSPATQRSLRLDSERVQGLENIQWQVISYWQQKEVLPAALAELSNSLSGWQIPADPDTGASYEYEKTGDLSFRLCATFSRPSQKMMGGGYPPVRPMMEPAVSMVKGGIGPTNWQHEAGRTCFDRTIDPDLYPPFQR
jgi:hypothetical protein